jgi:site-specific recombinase XerD
VTGYGQAVGDYIADCRRRGLRPSTLRYYEAILLRIARAQRLMEVADLDLASMRAFLDEPGGLSAGSLHGFVRAAKTFSRWLVDEGRLERDTLERLRPPRVDRRLVHVPSDAELAALLRASPPRLRLAIALLLATGVRVGELVSLRARDLRGSTLTLTRTKNRHERLVALDECAVALLERCGSAADPDEPLLRGDRGAALSESGVRIGLRAAARRAGLERPLGPHVLRHWHARDLARHGTTDRLLAARLGWRSVELIARYAPVDAHELTADTERYAPLVRLRDEGWLTGAFPASALAANSSKNDGRVGRAASGRS